MQDAGFPPQDWPPDGNPELGNPESNRFGHYRLSLGHLSPSYVLPHHGHFPTFFALETLVQHKLNQDVKIIAIC